MVSAMAQAQDMVLTNGVYREVRENANWRESHARRKNNIKRKGYMNCSTNRVRYGVMPAVMRLNAHRSMIMIKIFGFLNVIVCAVMKRRLLKARLSGKYENPSMGE